MTKTYVIDSGMNGYGMMYPETPDVHKLMITHGQAGFFSCSTIAMQDIVIWSREHKKLPDIVDRHQQYAHYKVWALDSLIGHFFLENDNPIDCKEWFELTNDFTRELQYVDYRTLNFNMLNQFRDKYFAPSKYVSEIFTNLIRKYDIDFSNTCAVVFRGNDKQREMQIAPYSEFIHKAQEVNDSIFKMKGLSDTKGMRYFVLPDETEFLQAFTQSVPNSFCPSEVAHMPKQDSAVFYETPKPDRANQAANFLAALIVASRCKHLIIHSGNVALWSVIYRGNCDNVHQIREGVWL